MDRRIENIERERQKKSSKIWVFFIIVPVFGGLFYYFEDIQDDFECALEGIIKLPSSSRLGVYVAYRYYFSLFKKIKKVSSDRLMEERIRVPNTKKLLITFESMFQNQFNWI